VSYIHKDISSLYYAYSALQILSSPQAFLVSLRLCTTFTVLDDCPGNYNALVLVSLEYKNMQLAVFASYVMTDRKAFFSHVDTPH